MAIGDEQQTAMVGLAFCNDQESPDKLNIVICSNFIVHLHYTNIRIYIQYKYEYINIEYYTNPFRHHMILDIQTSDAII